jgi:predicted membrane-bound mannosyltransferase
MDQVAYHNFVRLLSSLLTMFILRQINKLKLTVLSLYIFSVPWFLIVSVIYGTSVSMDLIPLWIIGPIIVGLSIKAGIQISAVCRRKIADMRLEEHVINLIEGVKSGELPRRCIQGSLSKYEEVKIVVFTKKSDVASFIQNGEIMPVLRQYYSKKLEELAETWSDKYQDARLFYLYVERKLKNII